MFRTACRRSYAPRSDARQCDSARRRPGRGAIGPDRQNRVPRQIQQGGSRVAPVSRRCPIERRRAQQPARAAGTALEVSDQGWWFHRQARQLSTAWSMSAASMATCTRSISRPANKVDRQNRAGFHLPRRRCAMAACISEIPMASFIVLAPTNLPPTNRTQPKPPSPASSCGASTVVAKSTPAPTSTRTKCWSVRKTPRSTA